jgi:hypothetical protein
VWVAWESLLKTSFREFKFQNETLRLSSQHLGLGRDLNNKKTKLEQVNTICIACELDAPFLHVNVE